MSETAGYDEHEHLFGSHTIKVECVLFKNMLKFQLLFWYCRFLNDVYLFIKVA